MFQFLSELMIKLIQRPFLVFIMFGLLVIAGLYSFRTLPIDAFPDLTNNQVQVLTESPGMAAMEMEELVTIPVESMMNGIPGVEQVRSISKFGLSVVTVVFQDNVDIYFARQQINERLQSVKNRLPDGANPEMGPITTGMGEIYQYVVEGDGYSAMSLKTLHDWDIKYQLRTVPGVNEVNTWGGFTQEYVVFVIPEKLVQYKLTLNDVFSALSTNNANFNGGIIEHESEQYVVRGLGRVHSLEDIGRILVKAQDGIPIAINQIARVDYGQGLRQGAVTKDGKGEVVTGLVMMLKGENSRDVIQRVKLKIKEIIHSLPAGVRIAPFYDQTHLVEQTISTVRTNLMEGGMLVVVVLLLLLGNIRAALIVAAVIPLSMMFSFLGMRALGITANIMSLGAVDFGMIVDGSIVMVENTVRRLSSDESRTVSTAEIVQSSAREMARPILFGILIITVVYMPILTLQGLEYKMFSPMVFTVCFALLGSLLTALTLVPVLCASWLKGPLKDRESPLILWIRKPYLQSLDWALRNKNKTIFIALGLFLAVIATLPFLGSEFVPELDEGDLIVEVRNLPSISLTEATQSTSRIERVLRHFPEVKTVVSKTGRPDLATDPMGVYQSDVYIILNPRDTWRPGINKDTLVEAMSQRLDNEIVGTNFNFTQPIAMRVDELVSGVRSDVAVKIYGEDFQTLTQLAQQVEGVLSTVKGQSDLQSEKLAGNAQLVVTPDRAKMARYGINMEDIREIIETAIIGRQVSEVLEGKKRFALRVKMPQAGGSDPSSLQRLLVETADGNRIPVSEIATVQKEEGLEVIQRESGQRRIIVQCNVRGRDIGSFVKESQNKINQSITLPPGFYLRWGGQFENQERAMAKLAIVLPVSILVIFCLLMGTFSSARHALLVMTNVPFALIGGVIALWLRGMYLSVPAAIGFIALFGVAVLNGLVLVNTLNQFLKEGLPLDTAIREAAETRLRPVLMTALVASLGFLPMALSTGAGAEVQRPLATVVIGGLVTSTLLTLIVLPVVYRAMHLNQRERHLQATK